MRCQGTLGATSVRRGYRMVCWDLLLCLPQLAVLTESQQVMELLVSCILQRLYVTQNRLTENTKSCTGLRELLC